MLSAQCFCQISTRFAQIEVGKKLDRDQKLIYF